MILAKIHVVLAISCSLLSCESRPHSGEQVRSNPDKVAAESGSVFVSNYPLSYFAARISGSAGHVVFPHIDGDPAFWTPSEQDVAMMQQALVILLNGATFEKWRETVTLPERRVMVTSARFADRYLTIERAISHSHGPGAEHAHAGTAFTTWLDFSLATEQATAVYEALSDAGVGHETEREANFAALVEDLVSLDRLLMTITEARPSVPLITSHPVYDYLADRYGLHVESVLWEPDVYPDEHQWELLSDLLERHPAKWMIWEEEPVVESVERLREMGVESLVFNPLGNRPDRGDFISVMHQNVEGLARVFQ